MEEERPTAKFVYMLMCHDSYQGVEDHWVVSLHESKPEKPANTADPCGCCWKKYYLVQKEVLP